MAASLAEVDPDIKKLEQQVAQQADLVRRMIVRGTPTQAAEDRLRELEHTLTQLREQRQRALEAAQKRPRCDSA
jgi:predicted nuclease with TOPRIM domain